MTVYDENLKIRTFLINGLNLKNVGVFCAILRSASRFEIIKDKLRVTVASPLIILSLFGIRGRDGFELKIIDTPEKCKNIENRLRSHKLIIG